MDEHTQYENVNEWIRRQVPFEWEHAVCICVSPKYSPTDSTVCTTCNKAARWLLYTPCKRCHATYYSRFKHHKFPNPKGGSSINTGQRCFNCLVELYGSDPTDVPPPITAKELRSMSDILSDDSLNFDLTF